MTVRENRAFVSRLILNVLTDKICVREAILHFPEDKSDKSLSAAYHALVYREADEDLRRNNLFYKEEQDEFLEFIADVLSRGEDLPSNIIKNYAQYNSGISLKDKSGAKGIVEAINRYLNITPKSK